MTQLRLELYQRLSANAGGGLRWLLNEKADEFYRQLATEQAEQARLLPWLLVELTQAGENQEDTRKTVTVAELRQRQPARASEIDALLDTLIRKERLLTGDSNPAREATVTIAHEALLRDWGKLKGWLTDSREVKGWRESFSQDLAAWQAGSPDNLLRGSRLATAEAMLQKYADSLFIGDKEREFIAAGVAARAAEVERKRVQQWRRILALMAGLVVSLGLAAWATLERDKAEVAATQAKQAGLERTISLFDSKLIHASLLSTGENYAEASAVLRATYPLDAEIALSRRHARNLLASVAELSGGAADKLYEGAKAQLSGGLALSPDGRWLAAAGERATLVLFDADSGELVRRLEGHQITSSDLQRIWSIVFDPQSRWLYSADEDGKIIRWSIPDGAKLEEWRAPAGVMALALSPDGKILASGGQDKEIRLWEVGTSGGEVAFPEPVEGNAASPPALRQAQGTSLRQAQGTSLRQAQGTASAAPKVLRVLKGHASVIAAPNGLAFSPRRHTPRQCLV